MVTLAKTILFYLANQNNKFRINIHFHLQPAILIHLGKMNFNVICIRSGKDPNNNK